MRVIGTTPTSLSEAILGAMAFAGCLGCLLLLMYTHPLAKKVLTLHLAHSECHDCYLGCI